MPRRPPEAVPAQDYASAEYWQRRYEAADPLPSEPQLPSGLEVVLPFLARYEGQRFLEIGCEPGAMSAAIARRVQFEFSGLDYVRTGRYLSAMTAIGIRAHQIEADVRTVRVDRPYDVVGSFGLVEHFANLEEVMAAHDRLLRPGGLCIVTMPNLRGAHYLYHLAFDREDLQRHNLAVMSPFALRRCGAGLSHEVLLCRHAGRLRFWGLTRGGSTVRRAVRVAGAATAQAAGRLSGLLLPVDHRWFAPWIVYVARKTC